MTRYEEFRSHIAKINDLLCAISLLNWDARVEMPPGGAETRGTQIGTLSELAYQMFVSQKTLDLAEGAAAEIEEDGPDSYRVREVRQAQEACQIMQQIPASLLTERARLCTTAQQVWAEARAQNDFSRFAPYLEQILPITKDLAEAIGYEEHPYDALLVQYEPGMTAARLTGIFAELRAGILPLLEQIQASGTAPRTDFLERGYPEETQRDFALEMAQAFGYDLNRGRVDESAHPFEISFTRQDVRITTRYERYHLPGALFGLLHEAGHALYEQGVDPRLTRTALACDFLGLYAVGGASYGTHESQSRLWENLVGRSRAFWERNFSRLCTYFPKQLSDVDAETFYKAVNEVRPGLIRVEADEVTYNLHIMLRVELEMALLQGKLAVSDLPEAWNAAMDKYLGVTPPHDRVGVLQDIHWSAGMIGSFPTYTIGNLMGAQFFAAARRDVPDLDVALAHGNYEPLRTWLTRNIYRHGRAYTPAELLLRSTGSELQTGPYLKYLREKYTGVYGLA